jgi:glycosyltransferase involved in cell wall biosynthesis
MTIIQANKYYFFKGGAERYMFDLSRWLEDRGERIIPFAMEYPDNIPSQYSRYFVSRVQTSESDFSNHKGVDGIYSRVRTFGRMMYSLEARRNLATLISLTKPDVCHVHNIYTQISPSILHTLKDQRVKVVMTVHDHHLISPQYNIWAEGCGKDLRNAGLIKGTLSRYHKGSMLGSFAQTLAYKFHSAIKIYKRNVDLFVCPSQYMKRQLLRAGFDEAKIRVIPFGVDVNSFEPRFDHEGYFLFVGRLSEEKGIETVLHVARLMPDVLFKIVGSGPQMEKLHELSRGLANVEFIGFRYGDELRDLYRGAKSVLLPSRVHENFPLAILEAMAYGKPVIASAVGGIPEIIEDRKNGFLVSPIDLQGWVEAIMRLNYDDETRERMGRDARATIEHNFGAEKHFLKMMDVYRGMTNLK